ncbi:MAG: DNA repair protein RecO C-terminal domain-containing protein, partial [Synergistaceae bacterium]|nr:DNA repair protein RecO C-terminal domain-containing protein [Synergistaceae bacterium]
MEKVGGWHKAGWVSRQVTPFSSDSLPHGDHRSDGVVLSRRDRSPKSRECLIFMRGRGALWVGTPGAERNRFGGGTEPMTWGTFALYQSPRRLYLKSVDIAEDFLEARGSRRKLMCAVKWCRELASRLPAGHENDHLLSLLWGSMKNLAFGMNPMLLDMRFAWRWGKIWGVSPSFAQCSGCGAPLASSPAAKTSSGFFCGDCRAKRESSPDGGDVFYETLSAPELEIMRMVSSLPREDFMRAEPEISDAISSASGLEEKIESTTGWFYSFLRL